MFVLDGQGPAPAAATLAAFADLGLDLVPGSGLLAAVVPAAFGTWMLLLERYGTMRPRDVLEYAIGYAEGGYPMLPTASAQIAAMAATFRDSWPTSAEIYLASGVPGPASVSPIRSWPRRTAVSSRRPRRPAPAGKRRSRRPAVPSTRASWPQAIADYLDGAEVMDVTGERHRGLLTGADLAGWRASVEEPATLDFRGFTVCKTGPWGQGPVFLQQLALLDGLDLAAMGAGSADFIHAVTESCKLAMADREAWYGDPRFSTGAAGRACCRRSTRRSGAR